MLLVVNNLGGLSCLELGIVAGAAVRCLGECRGELGIPVPGSSRSGMTWSPSQIPQRTEGSASPGPWWEPS